MGGLVGEAVGVGGLAGEGVYEDLLVHMCLVDSYEILLISVVKNENVGWDTQLSTPSLDLREDGWIPPSDCGR